jgi:general secretion pathway protein D
VRTGTRRAALVVALLSLGCTTFHAYRRAQIAEQTGDHDTAVLHYMQAVADDPTNLAYRAALLRSKITASQAHFEKAKQYRAANVLDRALVELQQAVELDPTNQYAGVELAKVREEIEARARQQSVPATLDELKRETRGAQAQPPVLEPRSPEPLSINFPRPVSVQDIYRSLGKAFGFNVLFDPNLRDTQLAIELKDVTAEEALEIIARSAQHFYKVIDEHSILIAADNAQNRRLYEDLVIQTFFLSNADPKEVVNILRSLVNTRQIQQNPQLNAIVVRETVDKMKVAESIIRANDKTKSEVVVAVELMQLNTSKLRDLGVSLSAYSITQSLDLGSEDAVLRLSDLEFLNQNNWSLAIPDFVYAFIKQSGDAQLLAQPRMRISEGETGRLTIGDKVPIPVTTFNTGQTVGGNIVPITSFQYTDVGIKIEIQPRVHHNREVTLKLKIEVSNLGDRIQLQGGGEQPVIGTRSIESTIRLRDGETNFLAGLIRTDESSAKRGIPGISEIPLLGRLFSRHFTDNRRTDLILTLTPHIVRTPDVTREDLLPIWIGTEQNITFRGSTPRLESDAAGPFDDPGQQDPEQLRELIRQQVQNLPRGLQSPQLEPTSPEAGAEPQLPQAIDLARPAPPSDIFQPPPVPEEEQEEPEEEPPVPGRAAETAVPASYAATAAPAATTPAVRLRLLTSAPRVFVGETFEVAILAQSLEPVAHLPIALALDAERLAVERIEPGEFLGGPGVAQVLSDASRPGEVLLGASQLGQTSGTVGSGVVARVFLRALAAGPASVDFAVAKALGPDRALLAPVETAAVKVRIRAEREGLPVRRDEPAQ